MTRTVAADDAEELMPRGSRSAAVVSAMVRLSLGVSVGVAACAVAGCMGRMYWALELFSHFRIHYTVLLFLLLLAPLAARRWKAFVFVACLFVLFAVSLCPMWIGKTAVDTPGREVRLVTWNVNTANRRHEDVVSSLRQANADAILVLEIDDRWLHGLRRELPDYPYVVADPRDDNFGIGLFSRLPFEGGTEPLGSAAIPMVRAVFQADDVRFELVGVHTLPPKNSRYAAHRNDMFDKLVDMIPQINAPVLLLGDLNVTPWSPSFVDLLEGTGLADGRRGFGLRPTWPARLGPLGIPIDHCLVTPGVVVRSFEVGPGAGSDHRAVVVELTIPSRPKPAKKTSSVIGLGMPKSEP